LSHDCNNSCLSMTLQGVRASFGLPAKRPQFDDFIEVGGM
jgi:hypothetical protein